MRNKRTLNRILVLGTASYLFIFKPCKYNPIPENLGEVSNFYFEKQAITNVKFLRSKYQMLFKNVYL